MQAVGFAADAREAGDARQADQVVGVHQRLLHQHHQRGTAGEGAAVLLVLVQQGQRLGQGAGRVEVEVAHRLAHLFRGGALA